MEKEEPKDQLPKKKRRVSLFKRRKKSDIRPFVRERKHREYNKFFRTVALAVLALFVFAGLLYGIKSYALPLVFHKNVEILTPTGNGFPDDYQIKSILQNKALNITGIEFASDSATVSFFMFDKTKVFLSKEKDIEGQLDLVEAVYKQMAGDLKQAISIDLRYNKPIVKF